MSKDMPGRMLRLLSLLQGRREWSGTELAERLGVTGRTVRRDIDRLRALDYPVDGTTGTAGGYRLRSGRNIPPLLLDDEEAIAIAIGLVTAAGSTAGAPDSSMRAFAKLEQVLPARLRPRLAAITGTTTAIPNQGLPQVDPPTLALLAACCRDQEVLSFDYRSRDGSPSIRRVEPRELVTFGGRWYLLAFDVDRDDWRTFRIDRLERPLATHRRFSPRELPAETAADYVATVFARASYRYTAVMAVRMSAEAVRAGVFGPFRWGVTDTGPGECSVRLSADSPELVVQHIAAIAALGAGFTLDAPAEITDRLRSLGANLMSSSGT
ncbi:MULTISPECIES: helix-turn-helix transcriptional regulator [Amycolatopsis]|uniref:YafY family protein n=1 Tax=Amycolatopsis samaneae TaxID=664691 RepID=A0ABW5GKD0_9PSEU